jgi:hypothetical protein
VVVLLSAAALAGLAGLAANSSAVGGSGDTFSVTYTSNTVVVPSSIVAQQLSNISADGNTFTFRSAAGPLASLAAGKVMLLQGKAVAVVTGVSRSGGALVVTTHQPTITDFIKSGTIHIKEPVTFAGATLAPEQEAPPEVTFKTTRLPAMGDSAVSLLRAKKAAHLAGSYIGSLGPIAYDATLSPASGRYDFDITYKFNKNDLEGTIEAQGYVDSFDADLAVDVANDRVASSEFLATPFTGHVKVTWTLGRGATSHYTIKVPVFTLPFSLRWPFIFGGLPFFVKVTFQTTMTAAISAKNGIIQGGAELNYNGSGGGFTTGGALTTKGAMQMADEFLSSAGTLTLATSGAVLGFNAPKITFGIGLPTMLNGTAYLDVISALGQTTGSAVAGQSCSKYNFDFAVKAGVGAELIKSFSLPPKVIFSKSATRTQGVGC